MEEINLQQETVPKLPERNPETHAAHRRSFFWQVTLPFIILLLVFFGLIAGVSWGAVTGSGELRRWADVALIWQLPLPIFLSLLCLVVHAGMLYGLIRLVGVIPGGARLVHNYVLLVQLKVNEISDRLVAPIIRARSNQAKANAVLRALKRNK
jgi:hypothetical protein